MRGNGKIIQELEADFRGAGWNVIKVSGAPAGTRCWPRDTAGMLRQLMDECVDGEYQDFKSQERRLRARALLRQVSRDAALVADMTDDEIWR